MVNLAASAKHLKEQYWPLIKSRQTFLLTLTGVAGYFCERPMPISWPHFVGLIGSMLFTIGGCTVLNMVFDRDIDYKMSRTNRRPLATQQADVRAASILGGALLILGLAWSWSLSMLYFILALSGAVLDVLVYTLWLKRRMSWSINWGGLTGGIPNLAGTSLVTGRVEVSGLLLALAIVCWIPSHNLSLAMLYPDDYINAGIPTFLTEYGQAATIGALSLSSLLTAVLMSAAFGWLNLPLLTWAVSAVSGLGLIGLALYTWKYSGQQGVRLLYKYSSFYMLAAMLLLMTNLLR